MGATAGFEIETIQAGQICRAFDGTPTVAVQDAVQVTLRDGGRILACGLLTPEQAMVLAGGISQAAGYLISQERNDDGKPTSLLHRLRRLSPPAPPAPRDPEWMFSFLPDGAANRLPANREHLTDTPTGAIYRWPVTATAHMDVLFASFSTLAAAERAAMAHGANA